MNRRYRHHRLIFFACLVSLATLVGCGQPAVAPDSETSNGAAALTGTTAATPVLYTFAVCGDNRIDGIENGVLERIVASAKAHGAAFIVDTGDVTTSGSRQELQRYRQFIESSGLKFYTVPGTLLVITRQSEWILS